MALFRLYFVQSLCVILYLFLERNDFLIAQVIDVYPVFTGAHSNDVYVPHTEETQKPFQERWKPAPGVPYNDTYYLDFLKSEWCPGIGSCRNPNAISNDTRCCLPCSCSEGCWKIGNCCYDKQDPVTKNIMSREVCDFTGIIGTKHGFSLRQADSFDDFYMFIDSCDYHYEGIETYKCTYPNLQNLTEITPVYDPVSGLNYKNMFCAICSHVTTPLVRWLPKLINNNDLINILQNKEIIFEDIHLPLGVSVIWIPQNINFTTCVGQSYIRSKCQEPELATELLSNLCQYITMPVKYNIYIYKNMYCILCSTSNFQQCNIDVTANYIRYPFAMLLSYDSMVTSNYATSMSPPKCSPDLTYIDDLIYCGSSIMQIKGQCKAVMDNISGTSLHFRIQIVFLASHLSEAKLDGIKGFTKAFISTNEFDLREEDNLLFQMNSTDLGKHILFHIKAAVHLDNNTVSVQNYYTTFITKLNATKMNPYRSSLQEFGIIDVSQGDYGYNTLALDYLNFATFTDEDEVWDYGVAMTNLQSCSSVRIKQFVYADNNQIIITFSGKTVTFKWSEYVLRHDKDGHVAQICLDAYVSRVLPYVTRQPASASSIRETSTIVLIILLFEHMT